MHILSFPPTRISANLSFFSLPPLMGEGGPRPDEGPHPNPLPQVGEGTEEVSLCLTKASNLTERSTTA